MISKEEAMNKLKKAGYNVVDDNSVLTILIPKEDNVKNVVKKISELFQKIEYKASFGVKQHMDALNATDISGSDAEDIAEDVNDYEDIDMQEDNISTENDVAKSNLKVKTDKKSNDDSSDETDDDFLDEEDDEEQVEQRLDNYDMDMLLGEEGIQFSLDDFGMLS